MLLRSANKISDPEKVDVGVVTSSADMANAELDGWRFTKVSSSEASSEVRSASKMGQGVEGKAY